MSPPRRPSGPRTPNSSPPHPRVPNNSPADDTEPTNGNGGGAFFSAEHNAWIDRRNGWPAGTTLALYQQDEDIAVAARRVIRAVPPGAPPAFERPPAYTRYGAGVAPPRTPQRRASVPVPGPRPTPTPTPRRGLGYITPPSRLTLGRPMMGGFSSSPPPSNGRSLARGGVNAGPPPVLGNLFRTPPARGSEGRAGGPLPGQMLTTPPTRRASGRTSGGGGVPLTTPPSRRSSGRTSSGGGVSLGNLFRTPPPRRSSGRPSSGGGVPFGGHVSTPPPRRSPRVGGRTPVRPASARTERPRPVIGGRVKRRRASAMTTREWFSRQAELRAERNAAQHEDSEEDPLA